MRHALQLAEVVYCSPPNRQICSTASGKPVRGSITILAPKETWKDRPYMGTLKQSTFHELRVAQAPQIFPQLQIMKVILPCGIAAFMK